MKSKPQNTSIPATRLASLLLAGSVSGASGATLVQTQSFSFVPNDSVSLLFNRFDTQGGTRTLDSVFIEISYTRTGGYADFDNESPSTATVNLQSRIDLLIDPEDTVLDLTKSGTSSKLATGSSLRTTATTSASLGADDDPLNPSFDSAGQDYYHWELPSMSENDSGYMANTLQFEGTDAFELLVDGTQTESISGVSGAKKSTSPSAVEGYMTITYNFTGITPVPEPDVPMLVGSLGTLLLIRRRR